MARGWEAKIGADTREFEQGIKTGIIKPVDEAARSLDDLADAGEDAGRDGARGLDRLEDALKDAERQSEKTERAIDDIGDTRGLGKVKDGAREVQTEIGQNMGEAFSSFRGEIEDVGQIGQDTLGGLAATASQLGPAGIVAGAGLGAAAAAVGNIVGAFERAKEASDEAKESAYQYGITVAESGQFADAASRLSEFTGSVEGLQKVQDIATISGWKQAEVLKALATGDGLPALTEAFNEGANSTTIATNRALELQGALDGAKLGFDLATDGARIQASALYDLATQAGVATGEVDDLGNKIVKMPDGKEVVIDAKTRRAYEDIDALEKKKLSPKNIPVGVDDRTGPALDRIVRRISGRVASIQVSAGIGGRQIV